MKWIALLLFASLAACAHVDNGPASPPVVDNSLPVHKPDPGAVCASHVLFFVPWFEQSVCGHSTVEQIMQAVCAAGGGTWEFTPGTEAQCPGWIRPKGRPKEA